MGKVNTIFQPKVNLTSALFRILTYAMGFVASRSSYSQPPVAPVGISSFNDLLEFRMSIMNWAGQIMREVADYVRTFDDAITANKIRDPNLAGASGSETTARTGLRDLGNVAVSRAATIIDTLLDKLSDIVVNPPTIDFQNIADLVAAALERELDPDNDLSVYALREVARSYVAAVLLDSAFDMLAGEETEIVTTVNAYIAARKAEADEDLFRLERRTINDLATDSVLDSEIAATTISRLNAKKIRLYGEIENKAEELRQSLRNEARNRAFERQKIRVAAIGLLPLQLPPGFADVLGNLVLRQFIDPSAFVGNLPGIMNFGVEAFNSLAGMMQRDRIATLESDTSQIGGYAQLLNVIMGNMSAVAEAVAKFATMEAS